jgi:hypothetical protein
VAGGVAKGRVPLLLLRAALPWQLWHSPFPDEQRTWAIANGILLRKGFDGARLSTEVRRVQLATCASARRDRPQVPPFDLVRRRSASPSAVLFDARLRPLLQSNGTPTPGDKRTAPLPHGSVRTLASQRHSKRYFPGAFLEYDVIKNWPFRESTHARPCHNPHRQSADYG